MDGIINKMSKLGLSNEFVITKNELERIIDSMNRYNVTQLTISELFDKIHDITMNKETLNASSNENDKPFTTAQNNDFEFSNIPPVNSPVGKAQDSSSTANNLTSQAPAFQFTTKSTSSISESLLSPGSFSMGSFDNITSRKSGKKNSKKTFSGIESISLSQSSSAPNVSLNLFPESTPFNGGMFWGDLNKAQNVNNNPNPSFMSSDNIFGNINQMQNPESTASFSFPPPKPPSDVAKENIDPKENNANDSPFSTNMDTTETKNSPFNGEPVIFNSQTSVLFSPESSSTGNVNFGFGDSHPSTTNVQETPLFFKTPNVHPPSASTFTNKSGIFENGNLNFSLGSTGKSNLKSRTPGKKQARHHRVTPNTGPTPQRARATGNDTDDQSAKMSKFNASSMKDEDKPPDWWNNLASFDDNNTSFAQFSDGDEDNDSDVVIDLTDEVKATPKLESDLDDENEYDGTKTFDDIPFRNIRIAESDEDTENLESDSRVNEEPPKYSFAPPPVPDEMKQFNFTFNEKVQFSFNSGANKSPKNIPKKAGQAVKMANFPPPPPPVPPQPPQKTIQEIEDEKKLVLADSLRQKGREYYSKEDYDDALDAFTKALNVCPKAWTHKAAVLGNRAATYMMLDQYLEAIKDCDQALQIDHTLIKLMARKGRALLKIGQLEAAGSAFQTVVDFEVDMNNHSLSTLKEIDSSKSESKAYLKVVATSKSNLKLLNSLESTFSHESALQVSDDLMQVCPHFHIVHVAKANALVNLQRWSDAKEFIESIIEDAPSSLLALHAHPTCAMPAPSRSKLVWREVGSENLVLINSEAIIHAVLCMGSELGSIYVQCLKNNDLCRSCCADIIDRLSSILGDLSKRLGNNMSELKWKWIADELKKVQTFNNKKQLGDKMFKLGRYHESLHHYSETLEVDSKAFKWAAIIHSNRAAAYMSLSLYNEAVNDCNEAIKKDKQYIRAYLRRARAYRSLHQHAASVRDYQQYLQSIPPPLDKKDIQIELDTMIEEKRNQTKKEAQSSHYYHHNTHQQQQQRKTNSNPNNINSTKTGFSNTKPTPPFANTRSFNNSGSFYSNVFDDDDLEDDYSDEDEKDRFDYFKNYSNQYNRFGSGSKSNINGGSTSNNRSNTYNSHFHSSGTYTKTGNANTKPGNSGSYKNTSGSQSSHNKHNSSSNRNKSSNDDDPDHYAILGVSIHASERDIKTAYRKLALQFHPDKNKDEGAEDRFKEITGSYAVLSDKTLRSRYDLTRIY